MNGPNGIYSSVFFLFTINNIILNIEPTKNAIIDIAIILLHPKNSPKAPTNFTSPNPTASFPDIKDPTNVINKKMPVPTIIPKQESIAIFKFETP